MAELDEKTIDEYLDTSILAGLIALENGAETARCENTMTYILRSSGTNEGFADVSSSTLHCSLKGKHRLSRIDRWDTNLYKVCEVNSVSRDLWEKKINIRQAFQKLERAKQTSIYPLWVRLAASMLIAVFLPLFTSGNLYNCIAAIVNGLIMGFASELFEKIRIRYFIVNIVQAFLMVLLTDLFAIITNGNIDIHVVLAASISPMLPGIALTNGVRDLFSGDYLSGTGRMMEALLKALSLALGVASGLMIERMLVIPVAENPFTMSPALLMVVQILAAFAVALGYAVRMISPPKALIGSAVVGMIGRLLYMVLVTFTSLSMAVSTLCATLVIALIGNLLARYYKVPTIVFLISGIMSLVPGTSLYNSVYNFVFGNMSAFQSNLIDTLLISGAIAVAIFLMDTAFNIFTMYKNKTLIIR